MHLITRAGVSTQNLQERSDWQPWVISGFGLLLVLYCTLFPFDFLVRDHFSIRDIVSQFNRRVLEASILIDFLSNILLFLPFAFGISVLISKSKLRRSFAFAIVLLIGFSLTTAVEVLQIFLASRDPSTLDILANSIGTFLGALCFFACGGVILRYTSALAAQGRQYVSIHAPAGAFFAYLIAIALISAFLQHTTHLGNWDPTFPLLLGNERSGNRAWRGYISEVAIADQALAPEEVARVFSMGNARAVLDDALVAAYHLTGSGTYPDQTGELPDLVWQGTPPDVQAEHGAMLTPDHWLATAAPVTALTHRLGGVSQFTLSTVVAAADTTQTGPARIISISGDPYQRNLTLGQEGSDLILRLRTPFTGNNGKRPELLIPDVFADTAVHHLIITYDGDTFRIYVDNVRHAYTFKLTPEFMLFQYLAPVSVPSIYPNPILMPVYKLLYYGLIFIPLGYLLALITPRLTQRFAMRVTLVSAGVVVPAVLLESILASSGARNLRPDNVFLGIAMAAGAVVLCTIRCVSRLPRRVAT